MTELNIYSHSLAITEVSYLMNGHFFGEDKRDITAVLDRDDTLDFIKSVNAKLYDTVSIETEGDYFYVTSSVIGSGLYIENVKTVDGRMKDHEGDILILPHYVPQEVRQSCIDKSAVVIEFALGSIYEQLVKIIES